MPRVPIPFVGPYAEGRSVQSTNQLCVNWMPRKAHKKAKYPETLFPTPGQTTLATAGSGACRSNGEVWNNKVYFVYGNKFISIDTNDNLTEIGTLNTSMGRCSIAAGVSDIMLVDGTDGWSYDGTTFVEITDEDFPAGSWCTWVDNYYLVTADNTNLFYWSENTDDPSSWTTTDRASAEKKADNLLRPIYFRGQLLLMGEETMELYYNSGNALTPWEAYPNIVFEFGLAAPASADVTGNTLFALIKTAEGGHQIIKASSENPTVISDSDLDWQLEQLTAHDDAEGFCYQQSGTTYYQITFPSAGKTWCWDDTNALWHERRTGTSRHRASGHAFFNNKHIIGSYNSTQFYTLDEGVYLDGADTIIRIRRTPHIHKDRTRIFYHKLELEMDVGVGLVTGQGSDPQVMLRWSDDNGHTWSNELWASIGKIGEYSQRAEWFNLGQGYQRIFEISISDPVNAVVHAAHSDIELGIG